MEHRIVSLLPLSHLLEQAVGLYYALRSGPSILYVRSRNPRVIFDALREHGSPRWWSCPRCSTCSGARSSARSRSPAGRAIFNRLRSIAPAPADAAAAAALPAGPRAARRRASGCSSRPARSCRRRSSRRGRTWASSCSRATARPRPGPARARPSRTTALGTVGRPPEGIEMRIADGRRDPIPRARRCSRATGRTPERDRGRVHRRRLVPDGRHRPPRRRGPADPVRAQRRTSSCCPTGSTCTPRTSRTPCASPGIRDSVVLETRPGRIEAIVLAPGRAGRPQARRGPRRSIRRRRPAELRADDRRRGQGGERDPRPEPADRRLAPVARGRTSRGRTRSRSGATAFAPGRPSRRPCRSRRPEGRRARRCTAGLDA